MITVSSNDATGFVVDSITGTTSGPELSGREWEQWKERREAVNRFFVEKGYRGLNANQKTFCEDAYGREQAFRDGGKNRNRMTTDVVARLFREIANGEIVGRRPGDARPSFPRRSRRPSPSRTSSWRTRARGPRLPAEPLLVEVGRRVRRPSSRRRMILPNARTSCWRVHEGVKTVPGVIPRVYEKVGERFAAADDACRRPPLPMILWLLGAGIALHRATVKVKLLTRTGTPAEGKEVPILFALWHGRMYLSIQAHRRQGSWMASQSRTARSSPAGSRANGYVVVRGSTSKGEDRRCGGWSATSAPDGTPR